LKKRSAVLAVLALSSAGVAAPQDSVSRLPGLPGDAVDMYNLNEQLNAYVVDMVGVTTSWGNAFGVAPIVKSGKEDAGFFNNSISAQGVSATVLTNVLTPQSDYSLWTTAGQGVNNDPTKNDPPGADIDGPIQSTQLAATFAEFNALGGNHVTTAVVNYNPVNPSRLFVSRIQAAVNGDGMPTNQNSAQIGMGAVDSHGNTYIRADNFGVAGLDPISGNNIYRVDALARNTSVRNTLFGSGPTDPGATSWLVNASGTTHNTSSCIPESIAGRGVYIGSNWGSQYLYESTAGVVSATTTHLGTSPDHRGNVSFSKAQVFGQTVGTGASYGKDGSNATRNILLWGVDANGAPSGNLQLAQPLSITDPATGYTFPQPLQTIDEYIYYLSQVSFRGSNGPVAVGEDQAGRIIVATVGASETNPPSWNISDNPVNAMFVARFDPANPGGTLAWSLAAYNDDANGKPILNGPGGTAIGRCILMDTASGGNIAGPSLSSPMIDSVGNIWFLSAIELFSPAEMTNGLIRAVYDPSTFSYDLELVLKMGDEFHGANSDTDYEISFMSISDGNSISSSSPFSGNIVQCGLNNLNVANMATSDVYTMGGMVFFADITYDYDDDGVYDPTLGQDQDYQVLMYLGPNVPKSASTATNYCTPGTSAGGCQATLSATGIASPSAASGFTVVASSVENDNNGLFFYGQGGQQANPWGNGTSFQCVVPPVRRGGLLAGGSTGSPCTGSFSQDLNARWCDPACPKWKHAPTPGQKMQVQLWYRYPMNPSNQTTSFSDALEVDVHP
jgi:hypothetical protein